MDAGSTGKTYWSKCCQEDKGNESLISPLGSFQREQDYSGYSNIASNLPLFHAINAMLILFNPARLDEGDGIEKTLVKNQASYHNSCRLFYSITASQSLAKKQNQAPTGMRNPVRHYLLCMSE